MKVMNDSIGWRMVVSIISPLQRKTEVCLHIAHSKNTWHTRSCMQAHSGHRAYHRSIDLTQDIHNVMKVASFADDTKDSDKTTIEATLSTIRATLVQKDLDTMYQWATEFNGKKLKMVFRTGSRPISPTTTGRPANKNGTPCEGPGVWTPLST